jgi:hypothetical protein
MISRLRLTSACLALVLVSAASSHAQHLDRTYEAHGGLGLWRSFRWVDFDLNWKTPKGDQIERHTFDLNSRDGLIKAEKYMLGAEKGEVWIHPNAEALGGTPPRFYMWTPFYFFAMPFVFADEGVRQEPLGAKNVGGVEYDAVKITFAPGTGDTPEDFYVAYLERPAGQLKIVSYIVTYPSLRQGKSLEELEQHAIVFEQWQSSFGLSVPKTGRLFNWKNDQIEGEPLGTLEFSGVRFSAQPPERDRFKKPEGAVVAPLQ